MSRLLHAAARGARIQTKWVDSGDFWQATGQLVLVEDMRYYRIHPADAHLQYGPISTEVRNYALGLPLTGTCWFARLALHSDGDLHALSPNDRYVFLLLVAEALADEGM
jgi:hypothetical protein